VAVRPKSERRVSSIEVVSKTNLFDDYDIRDASYYPCPAGCSCLEALADYHMRDKRSWGNSLPSSAVKRADCGLADVRFGRRYPSASDWETDGDARPTHCLYWLGVSMKGGRIESEGLLLGRSVGFE